MGSLFRHLASTATAVAVSAVVLWWLLADGTGQALIDAVDGADPWPLALGGLLAIGIQWIRAWRFEILRTGGLAPPPWMMVGIATKLVTFNFLLPFKLGELSFPLMMKRAYGMALGQGAGVLILCRLLDLAVVAAIILITAGWLLDPAIRVWHPAISTVLGLVVLIVPPLVTGRLIRMRSLTARWPKIRILADHMSYGASMMRRFDRRGLVMALTLSIWVAHAVIAWLVAIAIGVTAGFPAMAMASASSNLAFALPISGVAGLGPPQAAWATMLHWAGQNWAPAIASGLLCHGLLLVTLSTFGIAIWASELFRDQGVDRVRPSAASIGAYGAGEASPRQRPGKRDRSTNIVER